MGIGVGGTVGITVGVDFVVVGVIVAVEFRVLVVFVDVLFVGGVVEIGWVVVDVRGFEG